MLDSFAANLLGVDSGYYPHVSYQPRGFQGSVAMSTASGGPWASVESKTLATSALSVVSNVALEMSALLARISGSENLAQRRELALNFRQTVVQALQDAGFAAAPGGSPDKIVVDGRTYDIISSLNSPGTPVSYQFLEVTGVGGGGSAAGIVFAVGSEEAGLLDRISNAATIEERLQLGVQFRDKVIEALRAAGHEAADLGKPDKISIDGVAYDILRSINGLGTRTAVQMLRIGGLEGAGDQSDPRAAILAAGGKHQWIINEISASNSLDERRSLAMELQAIVVEALRAMGFTAQATDSPDKLVVNGTTYDFIRSLNSPGTMSALQTLVVV